MEYKVKRILTNGKVEWTAVHAQSIKEARERAAALKKDGATLRIYADTATAEGIQEGALTVVKRTTANMIMREGGKLQYRLYVECRRTHIEDPDVLDCISEAQCALIEALANGDSLDEQYHRAYLQLNTFLRKNRQINLSQTAQRTIYIEDINGEIVNVYGAINRILAEGEKYIPVDLDEGEDPDTLAKQRHIIHDITAVLTPAQIKVLSYMAKGYSERQIAEAMNRGKTTIHEHITFIKNKAVQLFPNGYKTITK